VCGSEKERRPEYGPGSVCLAKGHVATWQMVEAVQLERDGTRGGLCAVMETRDGLGVTQKSAVATFTQTGLLDGAAIGSE
jgi:hypothetical protein